MTDWYFVQDDPAEELAKLHYFSFKKNQEDGVFEFVITVKEYVDQNPQSMRFFAQSDREVNQKSACFRPFGWGSTLSEALSECLKLIRRHPCETAFPPSSKG